MLLILEGFEAGCGLLEVEQPQLVIVLIHLVTFENRSLLLIDGENFLQSIKIFLILGRDAVDG